VNREAAAESLWAHALAPWLVWIGLIAAFSPVLRELAGHLVEHPWARVSLIFPWLAWVAVREDQGRSGRESRTIIWSCLLAALFIELIAISGDVIRFARIALAIGAAGMIAGAGWARLTASLVLVFSVPTPNAVLKLFSPWLETAFAKSAAALVPGVEFHVLGRTTRWVTENAELVIDHTQGGLAMGVGLAGLGWFRTVVTGGEWTDAIRRAATCFMFMVPIQFVLFLCAAVALGVFERADDARRLLDEAGWMIVFTSGVYLSIQALRSGQAVTAEAASC
jgi:hypothetical protein